MGLGLGLELQPGPKLELGLGLGSRSGCGLGYHCGGATDETMIGIWYRGRARDRDAASDFTGIRIGVWPPDSSAPTAALAVVSPEPVQGTCQSQGQA